MTQSVKIRALLLMVIAATGVLLLAAGLPDLQLTEGVPWPAAVEGPAWQPEETTPLDLGVEDRLSPWLRGVVAFGVLLLLGGMVYLIVDAKRYTWLRPAVKTLAVLAGIGLLACCLEPMQGGAPNLAPEKMYTGPASTLRTAPLGEPPAWLFWVVTGVLLLMVGLFGIWLLRRTFAPVQRVRPAAQEAEQALAAIQAGAELSEVIIRCYLRMNQALFEERGIARDEPLTPREFETYLSGQGIPAEPLRTLTHLFESVRYGRKPVDQQAEERAVACLTAILQHGRAEANQP